MQLSAVVYLNGIRKRMHYIPRFETIFLMMNKGIFAKRRETHPFLEIRILHWIAVIAAMHTWTSKWLHMIWWHAIYQFGRSKDRKVYTWEQSCSANTRTVVPHYTVAGIVMTYLRYNFMDPSVSPREFFATHLYMPKSLMSTEIIVSFMETLYVLSSSSVLYLDPIRREYAKHHHI